MSTTLAPIPVETTDPVDEVRHAFCLKCHPNLRWMQRNAAVSALCGTVVEDPDSLRWARKPKCPMCAEVYYNDLPCPNGHYG